MTTSTAADIVNELRSLGTEPYRKVLRKHGAREPLYGVKVSDLKTIQKRIKKDYQLALNLFDTGAYDAQYLAGLIADDQRMTRKDLKHWLAKANCPAICSSAVAWVAAESRYGYELALEWIGSNRENTAQTGWATLCSVVAITEDAELDLDELVRLLHRVEQSIHQQPNQVRYVMNSFVMSVGTYVRDLTDAALKTAAAIGTVSVDMGETECKVPSAVEQIHKVQQRGTIGKKRKSAKC